MGSSSKAATGVLFASNVLMSGALSQVWGMINGLQIFVHLPLFDIEFPIYPKMVVSQLIDIATFDLLPVSSILSFLFVMPIENEDYIDPNFSDIGYASAYTIINLGMLFILFLILVFQFLVLFALKPLRRLGKYLVKWHD